MTLQEQQQSQFSHLVGTQTDRSHLQVELNGHLLLQLGKVLDAADITATRAFSPGANHVMHSCYWEGSEEG